MQHPTTPTRSAFGQILGHPTKPRLRYFWDGDAGAGGGDGGAGSTGNTGGDGSTGNGDGEPDPAGAAKPDAYAQALERMKTERQAARAEAKAFKDLGLSVEEIAELKAARDKAQGGPTEEQLRAQALRDAEKAVAERYAAKAREVAVREQANLLGFHSPKAALALLDREALAKVDVTDDEADGPAVKKLLEALATAEPYLVKAAGPTYGSARDAGIGAVGGSSKPDPGPGQSRIRAAYADRAASSSR